jgi:hypothetical protein
MTRPSWEAAREAERAFARRARNVLGVLAAAIGLWACIAADLRLAARRDGSLRERAIVADLAQQIRKEQALGGPAPAGPLMPYALDRARRSGFPSARAEADGDSVLILIDSAGLDAVARWADGIGAHGLVVTRVTAHPNGDGTAAFSISLRRRG